MVGSVVEIRALAFQPQYSLWAVRAGRSDPQEKGDDDIRSPEALVLAFGDQHLEIDSVGLARYGRKFPGGQGKVSLGEDVRARVVVIVADSQADKEPAKKQARTGH